MSKVIKLEIPAEPEYQAAAAAFFNVLTGEGVDHNAITTTPKKEPIEETPPPPPPPSASQAASDDGEQEVVITKGNDPESLFQDNADAADTVELDSAGFPWDERIHSSNHKKLATGKLAGTWQRRRGVADELVAEVEAELLANLPAASEEPLADDNVVDASEAFKQTENTPPPPPPPAQTTTPPEGAKAISNFPELMSLVVELKGAGKITDDQINAEVAKVAGVASVALMPQHVDKIPALGAALQAYGV